LRIIQQERIAEQIAEQERIAEQIAEQERILLQERIAEKILLQERIAEQIASNNGELQAAISDFEAHLLGRIQDTSEKLQDAARNKVDTLYQTIGKLHGELAALDGKEASWGERVYFQEQISHCYAAAGSIAKAEILAILAKKFSPGYFSARSF
jgi:hypothetical protein